MEDQPPELYSMMRSLPAFEDQLKRMSLAVEIAQKKINYSAAHDAEHMAAIEVIETFLRKKHRLCYGGQAINAHLPKKHKIYDPDFSVPDYDFFTPNTELDLQLIVKDLKRAGFTDIYVRDGVHEGTMKVYVNYVPVADLTEIDAQLYRILSKRELRVEGISYMDIDTLRMMMYLELSRPRGMISRWGKVYERVMLLNTFAPDHLCPSNATIPLRHQLTKEQLENTIQWIIAKHRVFAGLDLVDVYDYSYKKKKKQNKWIVHSRKPILLFSPEPEEDAKEWITRFQPPSSSLSSTIQYRYETHQKKGAVEIVPTVTIVYHKKTPLLFFVHQTACHGYFQLPMGSSSSSPLRIASLDTLITLYFGLSLWNTSWLHSKSMECLASRLIKRSMEMRAHPESSPFPFIAIQCVGHQTQLPSLIRGKIERKTARQNKIKQVLLSTTIRKQRRYE